MKAKIIYMIIILIILFLVLTACVAAMPAHDDSTQLWNPLPTPTLGLLYIEETVINPYPISVYEPYP
jgi:hypothetical protein